MEILLSAKNISKTFQGKKVLDNININVKEASALNAELSAVLTNGKQDLVTREEAVAMMKEYGFKQVVNLAGGILAWADDIDSSLSKY